MRRLARVRQGPEDERQTNRDSRPHTTAQHMMVRGLIERDRAAPRYALTNQGRAALAALLAQR